MIKITFLKSYQTVGNDKRDSGIQLFYFCAYILGKNENDFSDMYSFKF